MNIKNTAFIMEGVSKKISIITVLMVYAISFMINNVFFVNRGKVSAAGPKNLTKIVALIIDKDIYPSIQKDIQRYTTSYIQKENPDTKAIVLPINTQNVTARDIVGILENIYFEGIEEEPSKLEGVILIGDVPLPVIQENGYIYPSIYPYVDFEEQQFMYDDTIGFFTLNKPNGQAEIWHGILNFGELSAYNDYFQKLKTYANDPSTFVDQEIRYDDFIGLKKYIIEENFNYYANKNIFAEDIGYRRLNNLLFNTLKGDYNTSTNSLGTQLQADLVDTNDQELKNYANMIKNKEQAASTSLDDINTNKTPSTTLKKSIDEITKNYDGLISTKLLTKIQENIESAARRYTKDLSGNWMNNISSHYQKIVQQDNRVMGENPLLIQINNSLESGLDQKITAEKYPMTYPLPIRYENVDFYLLINERKNEYKSFFFGKNGSTINNIEDTNIYRGTYQNLQSLSGVTINTANTSVGSSYKTFSQQIEANRGYNLLNTETELALRSGAKQYLLHKKDCSGFGFLPFTDICLGTTNRDTTYGENHDFTDIFGTTREKGEKESPLDFAIRLRGGASPINLDTGALTQQNIYKLRFFNYLHAIQPIFDIAGGQKTNQQQNNTNSFSSLPTYLSMILTKDPGGPVSYPRATDSPNLNKHDNAINIGGVPFVPKQTTPNTSVDFFNVFQIGNGRTNVPASPILTLKRDGSPNGSGFADYKIFEYKLISTVKKNISPTAAEITGMNITTADRPIDNIRNITFQGIGGDVVQFNYPNLYEVPVYKTVDNILVLKNETEILDAIKGYLQNKVAEYNTALTTQQNKKTQYYQSHSAAFNFLGQANTQANPNRNYTLLPNDFLITQTIQTLDKMATTYGTTYIYGDNAPNNDDEKLLVIAKFLLYQNSLRKERPMKAYITEDIQALKKGMNINNKISNTMETYLTSKNNKGVFFSPTYNSTGYEVAYINSDGYDMIETEEKPALLKVIQDIQVKKQEEEKIANKILVQTENSTTETAIQSECGIDPSGTALIFDLSTFTSPRDLSTFTSPRMDAMKCWAKKTFQQPFSIRINYKNALGPTVPGFIQEGENEIVQLQSSWNNYSTTMQQQNEKKNETTINNSSPTIQSKLKEYETLTNIQIDNPRRFVDSAEPQKIRIQASRFLPQTQIRITGTGTVCLGLNDEKGRTVTKNLCTNQITIPLSRDPLQYTFVDHEKKYKAGEMVITTSFCRGGSSTYCFAKNKTITVLPGSAQKFKIKTPTNIVMMGSSLPLKIEAEDAYGNTIGQTVEQYTISISTGNIQGKSKIQYSNFSQEQLVYNAPIANSDNIAASIKIEGQNQNGKLISGEQKIMVAKGILNIFYANQILYSTNSSPKKTIGYTLPDSAEAIIKNDTNNIPQLQENALPKITFTLQDKNNNKLETVANIISKFGLVQPGKIQENKIDISGTTHKQTAFVPQSNIIISDGKADIRLFPTKKTGTDDIVITIPGLDPITIPIHIYPGKAHKVIVQIEEQSLYTKQNTTGTIELLDYRNNRTQENIDIKVGVLGPGTINNKSTTTFTRTGNPIVFTLASKNSGGKGSLFGYISTKDLDKQVPGSQDFFVQNSLLPETGLNIMYLNLFGTDRGNQWGYFSEYNKKINTFTAKSDKLLATTTTLINPNKIKEISVIIGPNGQTQNIKEEKKGELFMISGHIIKEVKDIVRIDYGQSKDFTLIQTDKEGIEKINKNGNSIYYIPEKIDSIITENKVEKDSIFINGEKNIDIKEGIIAPNITILDTQNKVNEMNEYEIKKNEKKIGTLYIYISKNIEQDDITIVDTTVYGQEKTFTAGSTNTKQGMGIFKIQSNYTKTSYLSIEDSNDPLAGIGFTSKFKNISNFAAGQNVGDSTLPYGSVFLINFGDPLLKRINKNLPISKTAFDGNPGQTIFTNPNKNILKTLPIDIQNDGIKDILVAYSDGSLQILKNYGGKNGFKDMKSIMIVGDPIKEVYAGDVDGDKFTDIIVWSQSEKIMVYKNNKGVIEVDGAPICLNTNNTNNTVSETPSDTSGIHQIFFEDMNKDNILDIITNDKQGDVKIFYGGKDSLGRSYYVSNQIGSCDAQRFDRQKNNHETVKSFGLKIQHDRYITDDSLVHRKNMITPDTANIDEEEPENDDTIEDPAKNDDGSDMDKDDVLDSVKNMVSNTAEHIVAGAKEMGYVDSPITKVPIYEAGAKKEDIKYLPISLLSGEEISVYKKYEDINGGILKEGDQIKITTTILSLANNKKITYIEKISGPRTIKKNTANEVVSRSMTGKKNNDIQVFRETEGNLLATIDNIQLNNNEKREISYIVNYKAPPLTNIKIDDANIPTKNIKKDGYLDIITKTSDPCIKSESIAINTKNKSKGHKEYSTILNDIDDRLTSQNNNAWTAQENQLDSSFQQIDSSTAQTIASLPGMSEILEQWNPADIISNGGINIHLNTNMIDTATAEISKKLDEGLKRLCQGFSRNACQGVPVPFNQAFLAPGEYHLFGCVPKAPNPLAAVFKVLNKTVGKGLPILSFPTNNIIPIRPPSPSGAGGLFGGSTSQFRLYIAPTMTLGMGFAICLGPYGVGAKLPKPIRDMAGNCIVFAIPGALSCNNDTNQNDTATSIGGNEIQPDMVQAAENGICEQPAIKGNRITFIEDNNQQYTSDKGTSSPLQVVEIQGDTVNPLIPQGDFGGLMQIQQEPIIQSSTEASIAEDQGNIDITLEPGEKIDLKIVGGKTKGLVKCIIQDWMTRQLKYIINNLTKMTVEVNLPDLTQITEGFDNIQNFNDIRKQLNQEDEDAGYSTTEKIFSKQQLSSISQKVGQNPFEAIAAMFNDVPLINITTKDINVKIPSLTIEEANTYEAYLDGRVQNNQKRLEEWNTVREELSNICTSSTMENQINNDKKIRETLVAMQQTEKTDQKEIEALEKQLQQNKICTELNLKKSSFMRFQEDSTKLISSVQENIKVIDQYKQFPAELYEWIHITDRYIAEIGGVTSEFVGGLTQWLDTNANRFSQYVDAITVMIGAIKTWQAIIDFSVNRSEKCSTCSNDNYGAFSCSLSFLCPQLPIFKIPSFKIPDITIDLSHIELGLDIVLPKFNFTTIKTTLPELRNLPEPPNIKINLELLKSLNLGIFENMQLPSIPTLVGPPELPELPSFIPNIELELPVLPPAPKIPNIIPEINGVLKVANFIGKVFCIVKGGIGLVGEKGVKAKIEQITQRKRNVPVFDFFDLTSKYSDPPLQGFDYTIDAYTRLKYNFEGVYTLIDGLVQGANQVITSTIEAPLQNSMNTYNSGINQQNEIMENIENNIQIDINGYLPNSGANEIEYSKAYQELWQGLRTFRQEVENDKKTLAQITNIQNTINADSKVQPAKKEILAIKDIADNVVENKQEEIKNLKNEIKDYDAFIKKIQKESIQLISDKKESLSLSTPLIKISETTKSIIKNQEAPESTYLAINKTLIEGYQKALSTSSPEGLNMTKDVYQKSQKYLNSLHEKISFVEQKENKLQNLVATNCVGGNCQTETMQQNGYSQDISAYVEGIFIETGDNTGNTMINVVNNPSIANTIEKKYTQTDINNDGENDLILRDTNTIYIKYGNQNDEHMSQGGNKLTKTYTKYYSYEEGNKRRVESIQEMKSKGKDRYATFADNKIKIWDTHSEVKNFSTEGQTFDTLQLTWKNSNTTEKDVIGYIIRYSTQIETFFEKIKSISFFGSTSKNQNYIIALPQNTNYATGLLSVDELQKKSIKGLLSGEIQEIVYYNPNEEKINITLNKVPRKRIYAQIATLKDNTEELNTTLKKKFVLYEKSSPRSNQIVAGKQILSDRKGPDGTITLQRVLTNETVSTGNKHQGRINTNYTLQALREDTNPITYMEIEHNGEIIQSKSGTNITGAIMIANLFYTGSYKDSFIFRARDANNNISKEKTDITINIPNIKIENVIQMDEENAQIIAQLEHDIDEGLVTFQRERNGKIKAITGTQANSLGGFSIGPGQKNISGGIMSIGNLVGLFAPSGEEIGNINPKNGKITINKQRENKIIIELDFVLHIPTIKILLSNNRQELFQISLPMKKTDDIIMRQGKPIYQTQKLTQSTFGPFQYGTCIQNTNKECFVYINEKGRIYIPSTYNTTLQGRYSFDAKKERIIYSIIDENETTIADIVLEMQPLFE